MARDRPPDSLLSDTHVAASLVVLCGICGVSPRPAAAYPDNPVTGLVRIENRYLFGFEQTLRASKKSLRLAHRKPPFVDGDWVSGEKPLDILSGYARLDATHPPPMKKQATPAKRKAATKTQVPAAKAAAPSDLKSRKNLTRFNYETAAFEGWRLSLSRTGTTFTRYFPDKKLGGPMESLAAAEKALAELKALIDGSKLVDGKLSPTTIRKGQKLLAEAV